MNAIRKLGVGLSLDDFGTGYSSLSRLAHLPIRELKIDRSFMRDIESDASALAIVTAVVRVGQSLQLTVVAEGVETEGQLEFAGRARLRRRSGISLRPRAVARRVRALAARPCRRAGADAARSVEAARSQPTPSLLIASTGGWSAACQPFGQNETLFAPCARRAPLILPGGGPQEGQSRPHG